MSLGGHAILLTGTFQRSKEVCTVNHNFVIFHIIIMEDTRMKGETKCGYEIMQFFFVLCIAMVIRYTYLVYYK